MLACGNGLSDDTRMPLMGTPCSALLEPWNLNKRGDPAAVSYALIRHLCFRSSSYGSTTDV